MIRQEIYIKEYNWVVHIYYAVTCYYAQEILAKLYSLGCSKKNASIAWENMCNDSLDHGLTYSDIGNKESIIVIGLSSSAGEFLNSLIHEIHHLVSHICEYYNISLMGEESCYIAGDIALLMYPKAKRLLCNCCRESLYS